VALGVRRRRSLARAEPHRDPFAEQQNALVNESVGPIRRPVAAVSAQRAVGGDDTVARDEQGDGIAPDRSANRPGRSRGADTTSDLPVTRGSAPRDPPYREEDAAVEDGSIFEIERDVHHVRWLTRDDPFHKGERCIERRLGRIRSLEGPRQTLGQTSVEGVARDAPSGRDNTSFSGGEVERAERTRKGGERDGNRHGPSLQAGRHAVTALVHDGACRSGRHVTRRGGRLTLDMSDRTRILTDPDPRDLPGDFAHRVVIDVRFADTDAMGHVNNAVYLTYCEMARIRYWSDVTGEPVASGQQGAESLILAEARITYRAPLFHGERVTVETRATHIGRSSFTLEHRLTAARPGAPARLVAVSASILVRYDYATAAPVPLDPRFVAAIEGIEGRGLR
jgi:acyl-CoA thioester hydrolase